MWRYVSARGREQNAKDECSDMRGAEYGSCAYAVVCTSSAVLAERNRSAIIRCEIALSFISRAHTEAFVSPIERAPANGGTASRRRQRTTFTPTQADTLEKEYLTDQYMPRTRRILIAESLGLSEGQVKTWFQNRRAKEKRNDKNTVATNIQRHSLPSASPGSSSDDSDNHALVFQQLSAKNFSHVQLAI
uniref:Homeobox domain-containing protein n=1 Tax=Parascaris univalens TaxID=6257 RepID=A0A915AUR4_PARUN